MNDPPTPAFPPLVIQYTFSIMHCSCCVWILHIPCFDRHFFNRFETNWGGGGWDLLAYTFLCVLFLPLPVEKKVIIYSLVLFCWVWPGWGIAGTRTSYTFH